MPTIYSHQPPNNRLLNFTYGRIQEIKERITQLKLEMGLMEMVLKEFDKKVCPDCKGEGIVMICEPGCEIDGPRQHTCPTCKGKRS